MELESLSYIQLAELLEKDKESSIFSKDVMNEFITFIKEQEIDGKVFKTLNHEVLKSRNQLKSKECWCCRRCERDAFTAAGRGCVIRGCSAAQAGSINPVAKHGSQRCLL
jgi:nitrate/TMAO reductase-like tetraheme cytochrome c subunit